MVVWVADWEIQCCGDPFAVGRPVEWWLVADPTQFAEFLAVPLGDRVASSVTHWLSHHHGVNKEPRPATVRGQVISINAAYWRLVPEPESWRIGMKRVLSPATGTGVLEQRQDADGWEPEVSGMTFGGYLVELVPLD